MPKDRGTVRDSGLQRIADQADKTVAGRHSIEVESARVTERRSEIIKLVMDHAYQWREEPFLLSSGDTSHDYIDGKLATATREGMEIVARAILDLLDQHDVEFDAVGGLTLGADPIAHAVTWMSGKPWFSVRKTPKEHGKQKLIEGTEIRPGMRIVLVDDIVTTGRSILQALTAIEELAGNVVLAVTLVDRGEIAGRALKARRVRYEPLATYEHLNIEPVGGDQVTASATG